MVGRSLSFLYLDIKVTPTNSVSTIRKGYYHFRNLTQSQIMRSSELQLLLQSPHSFSQDLHQSRNERIS